MLPISLNVQNPYISIYEAEKQKGKSYVAAIQTTLDNLKKDREKWGYQKKIKSNQKIGWRGIWNGLFYSPKVTMKNMQIIDQIQSDLAGLENQNDNEEIARILISQSDKLSVGQTSKFILYVIENLESLDYTTRPSTIIQPAPMEIILKKANSYADGEQWTEALQPILKKKNLSLTIFSKKPETNITLKNDILEHAKWVFNHIYCVPYPGASSHREESIARFSHGIQHVSRVALHVSVFANLYRKHGDKDAATLSDDDLKLLQIAALFHDSAREGEGVDKWDHESAILLYYYFTRVLAVDKGKAKLIAEAVANKDPSPAKGYFEIKEKGSGKIIWQFNQSHSDQIQQKNIYQKIIHDADCLDIIRARPHYDARYLDFYKEIVKKQGNTLALEEMAHLITEARSLIEIQGDSYNRTKPKVKKHYEHENAYQAILNSISKEDHKIIYTLGRGLLSKKELKAKPLVDLRPYVKEEGLTESNMQACLREGKVFARGIGTPSAIAQFHRIETLAELEVRKTMREIGIATTSSKKDRTQKTGNPVRSVSMIGYGSGVFTNVGFLIVDPTVDAISEISAIDSNTGRGKKSYKKNQAKTPTETLQKELSALHEKLKIGGETTTFNLDRGKAISNHVEILYDIEQYHAIFFSNDPNLYNVDAHGSPEPVHRFSPILQALYLREVYKLQYEKTRLAYLQTFGQTLGNEKFIERFGKQNTLPLFGYSGIHNKIRAVPESELSDDKITQMWVEMCSDYMKATLSSFQEEDVYQMNLDDIKIYSMYKVKHNYRVKENGVADSHYPQELRAKIAIAIEIERKKIIEEHEKSLVEKINSGQILLFSNEAFFNFLRNPLLMKKINHEVVEAEIKKLESSDLFEGYSIENIFGERREELRDIVDSVTVSISFFPAELLSLIREVDSTEEKITIPAILHIPAIKVYMLAKQLSLQDSVDKIQSHAIKLIEESIKSIRTTDNNRHSYDEFIMLIRFLPIFDLTSKFKSTIDNILNNLFEKMPDWFEQQYTKGLRYPISACDRFLKIIKHVGLYKPEHILYAEKVYALACEKIMLEIKDKPYDIPMYIIHLGVKLSKSLNKDSKKDLFFWLKESGNLKLDNEKSGSLYDLREICKIIPLNDDNIDFFNVVMDNMVTCLPLKNLIRSINNLQTCVKDKSFSQKQREVIQHKLDEKWKQNIDRHGEDFESFLKLLQELNNLLYIKEQELDLFMPGKQVIDTFNTYLAQMVALPNITYIFSSSGIATINKLHDFLPEKEKRTDAIKALANIKVNKSDVGYFYTDTDRQKQVILERMGINLSDHVCKLLEGKVLGFTQLLALPLTDIKNANEKPTLEEAKKAIEMALAKHASPASVIGVANTTAMTASVIKRV